MNCRDILSLSAIIVLALTVLPGSAISQQKSLKDQLIGAWTLVSQDEAAPDGTRRQPYGANPKGTLILDASGRYSFTTVKADRPKLSANRDARNDATTVELGAAALGFEANFGTWSVSETDKVLIRRLEGALIPNNEGSETRASIILTGDELKLVQTRRGGGSTDRVYKRAN